MSAMKVLFYRYGSICEPDVMDCFRQAGLTVVEEKTQITDKQTGDAQTAETVSNLLAGERFLFVFTINFFPVISDVCKICDIPYVCWTVDSPVMELFSDSLANNCNRVFLFDRAQYNAFRDKNPGHIFHLPLATNVFRWDQVIAGASPSSLRTYSTDVSFVGSLYGEHNAWPRLTMLNERTKGYVQGLVEAQLRVYGYNFIEEALDDAVLQEIREKVPEIETKLFDGGDRALRYYVAHALIGFELAQTERTRLLNVLADRLAAQGGTAASGTLPNPDTVASRLHLFTNSDTSALSNKIRVHGTVKTLTEMPLVFHESKINLNFTMRPIMTGLPLRVFDVCGCGGFLLTNYQEELAGHYEPGIEAEFFTSQEELLEKTRFYLSNEDIRKQIAQKGYVRTRAEHTYAHRVNAMIKQVMETL